MTGQDKIKVKIVLDTNEKPYIYTGFILKEENDFIDFLDDRSGTIRLNRQKIISIKEVQQWLMYPQTILIVGSVFYTTLQSKKYIIWGILNAIRRVKTIRL